MLRKESIDALYECVRIFDLGKTDPKEELKGVQFVEREESSVTTTLLFATGSVQITHTGVPKSTIQEGFYQYGVPTITYANWSLADTGNVVNPAGTLYPIPGSPTMALKAISGSLNAKASVAMPVKMASHFSDVKYVYMEGRDIFYIKDNGDTTAAWASSSADLKKALICPSAMTKAFLRMFAQYDDSVVSFVDINGTYTAMQLTSAKMRMCVSHVLALSSESKIDASFCIGKTKLRLVKSEKEFNLIKGEEKMDVNQVAALFNGTASNEPVVNIPKPAEAAPAGVEKAPVEPVTEVVEPETPATEKQVDPTVPAIEKTVEKVVEEAPAVTEEQSAPEAPVDVPIADALAAIIEQVEGSIATERLVVKGLREILKRVKKADKTSTKALEDEISDLKARVNKLKKALDAAIG